MTSEQTGVFNQRGIVRTGAIPDGGEGRLTVWTTCECTEADVGGVPTPCGLICRDEPSPHGNVDDPRFRVDITIVLF